jgi:transcriptional antiterminator RfaH
MPILPAEPDMYPHDLWDEADGPGDPGRRWWCLRTKPRQEKAAARHLRTRGIAYYLPQAVRESRTPAGRKLRSLAPLFDGYLFLYGDPTHRLEAFEGHHLAQVLEVDDQRTLADELRQIHRMTATGLPIVPEPSHPVGARVRIISGPLAGLIGTVVRRERRDEFIAVVRFLGLGARVHLHDWCVEHAPE